VVVQCQGLRGVVTNGSCNTGCIKMDTQGHVHACRRQLACLLVWRASSAARCPLEQQATAGEDLSHRLFPSLCSCGLISYPVSVVGAFGITGPVCGVQDACHAVCNTVVQCVVGIQYCWLPFQCPALCGTGGAACGALPTALCTVGAQPQAVMTHHRVSIRLVDGC